MSSAVSLPIYGSLLLAGVAASLHCVGMCGPILLAFTQVFRRSSPSDASTLGRDFLFYHAGRIWTYAMLGFFAGLVGHELREGAAWLGWQKPLAVLLSTGVIIVGLLLSGVIPSSRIEAMLNGCGIARMHEWRWFSALLNGSGPVPRLLLGAVMGLLPCGLVYAMLVLVATLPTPLHSMLGMLVFGLGTLPSLTAVLLLSRPVLGWIRNYGTRIVALTLILTGCFMLARSLTLSPDTPHRHHGRLEGVESTEGRGTKTSESGPTAGTAHADSFGSNGL
jgi:sulfite exporter TauE/SafE